MIFALLATVAAKVRSGNNKFQIRVRVQIPAPIALKNNNI